MPQSCDEVNYQPGMAKIDAQDAVRAKGDIDRGKMDVLALVFRCGCGLQGVDLVRNE
jgi:hypothetical protein